MSYQSNFFPTCRIFNIYIYATDLPSFTQHHVQFFTNFTDKSIYVYFYIDLLDIGSKIVNNNNRYSTKMVLFFSQTKTVLSNLKFFKGSCRKTGRGCSPYPLSLLIYIYPYRACSTINIMCLYNLFWKTTPELQCYYGKSFESRSLAIDVISLHLSVPYLLL